jgi:hypothetical protein
MEARPMPMSRSVPGSGAALKVRETLPVPVAARAAAIDVPMLAASVACSLEDRHDVTGGFGDQNFSCLFGSREGREGAVAVLAESVYLGASVALLAINLREYLANMGQFCPIQLNQRPRKTLAFHSPAEVLNDHVALTG